MLNDGTGPDPEPWAMPMGGQPRVVPGALECLRPEHDTAAKKKSTCFICCAVTAPPPISPVSQTPINKLETGPQTVFHSEGPECLAAPLRASVESLNWDAASGSMNVFFNRMCKMEVITSVE